MKRGLWFLASLFVLLHPLQVYAADELMLGGNSVGIEIDYDGVYVSGTYQVEDALIHLGQLSQVISLQQ